MDLHPPLNQLTVHWLIEPPDGVLSGSIYTDGSAIHSEIRAASRAGWGVAMIAEGSDCIVSGAAYGALPTFTQTSGCAEIYAAAIGLRMASPPVEIVTDYEQLLHGWELGEGAFTHPGGKNAEAWVLFWQAARDFGLHCIVIKKVPAHKPFLAVCQGLLTYKDWLGNRKADELAKRGVPLHPPNDHLVKR